MFLQDELFYDFVATIIEALGSSWINPISWIISEFDCSISFGYNGLDQYDGFYHVSVF